MGDKLLCVVFPRLYFLSNKRFHLVASALFPRSFGLDSLFAASNDSFF